MSANPQRTLRRLRGLGATLAALGLLSMAGAGCTDNDACKGRRETCLSISLSGAEGLDKVDQVQVYVSRQAKPLSPVDALGEPRSLPFKLAVLWPDGPATMYVRTFLQGKLNGLTAEISLDLRNGAHEKRKLTVFPPIFGIDLPDMAGPPPPRADMAMPRDMATPMDMATPVDMADDMPAPPTDLPMPPVDLPPPPTDLR